MKSVLNGIYVINMESDTVRMEEFDSMMKNNNWNYTRHAAINGKKLKRLLPNIKDDEERERVNQQVEMKKKY